ncbi:hypothetical protein OIU76_004352 [Salix suchowensis]|nr:hypothetical protein OIU76_004352 [Salix suchowensis]
MHSLTISASIINRKPDHLRHIPSSSYSAFRKPESCFRKPQSSKTMFLTMNIQIMRLHFQFTFSIFRAVAPFPCPLWTCG